MIRRNTTSLVAVTLLLASNAMAGVTNERNYTLGDDGLENASPGITVGGGAGNVAPGQTLDSGDPGDPTGSFLDIDVNGGPTYVDVTSRPGATPGSLGASFDGVDDALTTNFALNRPTDFWNNVEFFPTQEYPFNYDTILSHGIQLWAKPNPAGLGQGTLQHLIRDTTDGGGAYISENDTWGFEFDDFLYDSGMPVDTSGDGWTHLMALGGLTDLVTGQSAEGGALLVNGVAVAATTEVYDSQDAEPLTIGSNLTDDDNFYHGQLDDVRLFLWGDNSDVPAGPSSQLGKNYGALNLSEDNDWIAQELANLGVTDVADVNLDGTVAGDGTGDASVDDVTKFVEGWMTVRMLVDGYNGDDVQVGDWISRQNGDLNYDGIVNLSDWSLLNAADPAMGAAVAAALSVPEPSSLILLSLVGFALARWRRR